MFDIRFTVTFIICHTFFFRRRIYILYACAHSRAMHTLMEQYLLYSFKKQTKKCWLTADSYFSPFVRSLRMKRNTEKEKHIIAETTPASRCLAVYTVKSSSYLSTLEINPTFHWLTATERLREKEKECLPPSLSFAIIYPRSPIQIRLKTCVATCLCRRRRHWAFWLLNVHTLACSARTHTMLLSTPILFLQNTTLVHNAFLNVTLKMLTEFSLFFGFIYYLCF